MPVRDQQSPNDESCETPPQGSEALLHQEHFIGRFQPENRRARKDERAMGGPTSVLEGRNLMEATSNYVFLLFVKVLSGRERLPASSKMAVGAKIA